LAEWVKTKKPVTVPFGKKELEKFGFDVTKADGILDLLLQEGQLKLSDNHVIPSAKELKKHKYCKWHNSVSHNTNDCKVFRRELQMASEQGRIKLESNTKPMKTDGHPFPPVNMAEIGNGKGKVVADPKARSSAEKSEARAASGEGPLGPPKRVTSQMLLNKYRRQQDRERRCQEAEEQRRAEEQERHRFEE